jgi:trehalose 6-phosphate synthase
MQGVIIVSHRGPYTFVEGPDGDLIPKRGAGGVVSALGPLLHGGLDGEARPPTWIAAAIGAGERAAARREDVHLPGVDLALLDLPEEEHRLHYDVVSNEVLWFLHHGIFDHIRTPSFGAEFLHAWDAYRSINQRFADAVCERSPADDVVFVQDYQLALVPAMVMDKRPDLRVLHFTHIPFCGPNSIRTLPEAIATEYCGALARVTTGFHSERWARAYQASAREVLGRQHIEPSFAVPLGPDPDALHATLATDEATTARTWLHGLVGVRALIARTDRIEPTKNLVRGFDAYELFLERNPEWHDRVVFVACCYRSRATIAEYRTYTAEVEATVARINARFGTGTWQPLIFDVRDEHARSIVALERADVMVVNSLKDGLNLVAMEGPVVNARDGIVICSRDAGAFDVMADGVLAVNPYDVIETADVIERALTLAPSQRHALATTARALAHRNSPQTWLDGCLSYVPA